MFLYNYIQLVNNSQVCEHTEMKTQKNKMSILMLPWLADDHVSPFLELSKRLIDNNFFIYFCSTPIILTFIKKKINEKQSLSIKLVELHLPSSPELPPHRHSTKDLPSHLVPKLKETLDSAAPSFSLILEDLKPDLVIYDGFQIWAPTIASSHGIPAVHWFTPGASVISFALHKMKYPEKEFPCKEVIPRHFKQYTVQGGDVSLEGRAKKVFDFFESVKRSKEVLLLRSFEELEGEYIDYLPVVAEKKVVLLGPLIESSDENGDGNCDEIMKWLDEKDEGSTLFVSFESGCFMTKAEIEEVARGLELSNVNFLWVLRLPVEEETDINNVLPKGFLERVGERGKVWVDSAPRIKILAHSSIGGFMGHCGWNSFLESLGMGVPIVAVPMHLDQPFNARLIEELGVGMEVWRDEENGVIKAEEIAKVIEKVVVDKDGERMRKKAREIGDAVRFKEEERIGLVVKELTRICKEGK